MRKASTSTSGTPLRKSTKSKYMQIDTGQLRYAFQMLDCNKDGKLNKDEIKIMLNNLGLDISEKIVNRVMNEASKSGDGLIKEQDFLDWFSRFKTPKEDDAEADLKAAFMVFDKDGNGYITKDELKSAMQIMGEQLTDRDLDQLLRTTDHDCDGKINYEEFIKTLL